MVFKKNFNLEKSKYQEVDYSIVENLNLF